MIGIFKQNMPPLFFPHNFEELVNSFTYSLNTHLLNAYCVWVFSLENQNSFKTISNQFFQISNGVSVF